MASAGRALVAPDSFKGTLTAAKVAGAAGAGVRAAGWEADLCPVADGGEGTAEALLGSLGGERVAVRATGPAGDQVEAWFALLGDGRTAAVDVAAASGLTLVEEGLRGPVGATSRGTGELISAATHAGARTVLVGCGGSATTDGGAGALEAFDPGTVEVVCLCDTTEPFERAAEVFAPQKGADAAQVAELSSRLHALAGRLPRDPRGRERTGAAGGLAGGLWAHGARLVGGASHVCEVVGLPERMAEASLVITGEGMLDETTLGGKTVFEVATRARQAGVPCHAICGRIDLDPFGMRILDLQSAQEAGDPEAIAEAAGRVVEGAE